MEVLDTLNEWDQSLFLILNGWNAPWLDPVMWWVSQKWVWVPWYALLLFILVRKRWSLSIKRDYKLLILLLLSIALTIAFADQIASGILKPTVARLRPTHNEALQPWIHLLTGADGELYRGGMYGFVSSHAANSFALVGFLSPLLASSGWSAGLILWASLIAYSRIYLGVHYPGDVLVGALIGYSIGALMSRLYLRLEIYVR